MGGKLAIGIRRHNAPFETVVAWTNPLPPIIKSRDFLTGDFGAFEEYIDFYREDRAGQGYGPTRHVPSEYGYILFDFVDKVIASAQHYTTLNGLIRSQLAMWAQERPDDVAAVVPLITHRNTADGEVAAGPFKDLSDFLERTGGEDMFGLFKFTIPGWNLAVSGDRKHLGKVLERIRKSVDLTDGELAEWKEQIRSRDDF